MTTPANTSQRKAGLVFRATIRDCYTPFRKTPGSFPRNQELASEWSGASHKTREKSRREKCAPGSQNRLEGESFDSTRPQTKRPGVFGSRELPPRSMDSTSPSSSALCTGASALGAASPFVNSTHLPASVPRLKDSVYHETSLPRKDDDAACGQLPLRGSDQSRLSRWAAATGPQKRRRPVQKGNASSAQRFTDWSASHRLALYARSRTVGLVTSCNRLLPCANRTT